MRGGQVDDGGLELLQARDGFRVAGPQQGLEAPAVLDVEAAEGVAGGQLVDLLPVHVPGSPLPLTRVRSRSSPSLALVLTVPRGSPSRVAISACVRPS